MSKSTTVLSVPERIERATSALVTELRKQGADVPDDLATINGVDPLIETRQTRHNFGGPGIRFTFGKFGERCWVGIQKEGTFADVKGLAAQLIKMADSWGGSRELVDQIRTTLGRHRRYDVQVCSRDGSKVTVEFDRSLSVPGLRTVLAALEKVEQSDPDVTARIAVQRDMTPSAALTVLGALDLALAHE